MVLNQKQNFNHYLAPKIDEEEVIDLSEDAVLIEEKTMPAIPQRDLRQAPQEKIKPKEKMETFAVTLAGKEFVLPKVMTIEWPPFTLADRETIDFKFDDLEDEINLLTNDLLDLVNKRDSASEEEKISLSAEIQEKQNELREVEDLMSQIKHAWESKKSYYLVDLEKFQNLLEEKNKELDNLSREYDMAIGDEKLELEKKLQKLENNFNDLRQEYESYQNLQKDFQGRAKVTKPLIRQKDIEVNSDIWKLKVDKMKRGDEIDLVFSDKKDKKVFQIDMDNYVKENQKALELLLDAKQKAGKDDYSLGLEEQWWPQSVKMSIRLGEKNYNFDLAKYQKARFKTLNKIELIQKELQEAREKKKGFLEKDPEAQRLKKELQEKFAAWVNQKRETSRWKKEQEKVLAEKLEEARKAGDKDSYYNILEQWETAEEHSRRMIYKLDHEVKAARKESLAYSEGMDEKFAINKKRKKIERLSNDLWSLSNPLLNNPAWNYMNLFLIATEKVKDHEEDIKKS